MSDGSPTLPSVFDGGTLPEDSDLVFESPWQARAFAVAVAAYDQDQFDWNEFQSRLVDEIDADEADTWGEQTEQFYYERWLRALESLVSDLGIASPEELTARAREFHEGERDASEFVEADRESEHSHPHEH